MKYLVEIKTSKEINIKKFCDHLNYKAEFMGAKVKMVPISAKMVLSEINAAIDQGIVSPSSIMEGMWDAICDGEIKIKEARKDVLLDWAFRTTGGDKEKWLKEAKSTRKEQRNK